MSDVGRCGGSLGGFLVTPPNDFRVRRCRLQDCSFSALGFSFRSAQE